jgi:hypothetical protein
MERTIRACLCLRPLLLAAPGRATGEPDAHADLAPARHLLAQLTLSASEDAPVLSRYGHEEAGRLLGALVSNGQSPGATSTD